MDSIFYEDAESFPSFYFMKETGICGVLDRDGDGYFDYEWNPLQNIADAWMLVEKLNENGIFVSIRNFDRNWICEIGSINPIAGNAPTAQEAVSKATYKWVV